MPTGYTDIITHGASFETFALQCARAFGALIMMRDEPSDTPIPDAFAPSTYHAERLVELRSELESLRSMSPKEAKQRARSEYEAAVAYYDKYCRERAEQRRKYKDMLAHVKAWQPPSPDHQGLKDFMQSQIEESIRFDCSYTSELPRFLDGIEWMNKRTQECLSSIEYCEKADAEERKRTSDRNLWVRQLRESLK